MESECLFVEPSDREGVLKVFEYGVVGVEVSGVFEMLREFVNGFKLFVFFLDLKPRICGDVWRGGLGVVCFVLRFKFFVESAQSVV